jgi:hypothetical protein
MHVTLYLDSDQDLYHTSYVHAGIFGLAATRQIELELRTAPVGSWRRPGSGSPCVYMDVARGGGESLPLAFDLRDKSDLFDQPALVNAAIYFKRSYYPLDLARLDSPAQAKVVPFGMNFVCVNTSSAVAISAHIGREIAGNFVKGSADLATTKRLTRKIYDYWSYRKESDYLASPDSPKIPAVVFQTRIWEDHEVIGDDASAINEERVCLVRALKEAFGKTFVGGLVPNPLALKLHPDLVTERPVSPAAFAKWQRSLLVGVYTRGLHYSTAWKFGEYLAASMCVVAEPPRNILPRPLRDGQEFVAFSSADACVSACKSVLADAGLQLRLRRTAYDYYLREVSPEPHLFASLRRAVGLSAPAAS